MELQGNCPLCNHPIDILDTTIVCKHCGKTNEHHNIMFNCDYCQKDLEKMTCPKCKKEFSVTLLIGSYTYKIKNIEPFNIPPVDNIEAARFLKKMTGVEEFDFKWDEKPKSMMIYELNYAYPEYSIAYGMLLSISIDLWEHLLNSGEFSTMEQYLKRYVIGSITIEYGGNISSILIKAKPLKL